MICWVWTFVFRGRRHFRDILTLTGVYPDFDHPLFYKNMRNNVSAWIRAWHHSRS
jgi:hypothetical protein